MSLLTPVTSYSDSLAWRNSCSSNLEGKIPWRRSVRPYPAFEKSHSHAFEVGVKKRRSRYWTALFSCKRLRFTALSARDIFSNGVLFVGASELSGPHFSTLRDCYFQNRVAWNLDKFVFVNFIVDIFRVFFEPRFCNQMLVHGLVKQISYRILWATPSASFSITESWSPKRAKSSSILRFCRCVSVISSMPSTSDRSNFLWSPLYLRRISSDELHLVTFLFFYFRCASWSSFAGGTRHDKWIMILLTAIRVGSCIARISWTVRLNLWRAQRSSAWKHNRVIALFTINLSPNIQTTFFNELLNRDKTYSK